MDTNDQDKKSVWVNIYRLVKPYKRRLTVVFIISFAATAVTLVTPLIYREAINDIAGLFLQKARNDVKAEAGMETDQEDLPRIPFIEKLTGHKDTSKSLVTTTFYTYDTLHLVKDTTILKRVKHKKTHGHNISILRREEKIPETKIIRQPHTQTSVAPRTPRQAFSTLLWAVILLFIINILGLVFWRISENMNVKLSCIIERKFINRTFGHVLRLPLSFFVKRSSAALQKQIDQSEEISNTVTYLTKDMFPEIISLVGIVVIMLWQNHILALLALSVVPFYVMLTIQSTKKLEMSLSGYYEKWEDVSTRMQDALTGIKTVKLSGAEEREMRKLDQQAAAAYTDYLHRSFLAKKYSFWQLLLTHLATTLVLCYGGYLAIHHQLTPGDVVMFVAYLDMLYGPIDNLANLWSEIHQNVASVSRAFRLLDTKVPEKKFDKLLLLRGKVEFKNVAFGYTPERQILHHVSFTAEPGKITALVGESGAGKTTAVDLLLKLFEPQSGEILIDGQRLSTVDEASIRNNIGVVAADGAIFRGTLADNIRYKKPDATDHEVEAAAVSAGMQPTLERLPLGLETVVGEGGFGLSVGEKQRLQIARVIVDKPKILVLDEATANLDYLAEREIKKTIDQVRKENTVLIIAHRFSMVKDADHVIVLDEGKVIEEGTPATLARAGGWFARFAQAGSEEKGVTNK